MELTFTPEVAEVDCKEWNITEKLFVREPTAAEYAIFENLSHKIFMNNISDVERAECYARIGVLFLRTEDGKRAFMDEFIRVLVNMNSKPLRRLVNKIADFVSLEKESIKELEKN